MSFSETTVKFLKNILPSPFSIAVILTIISFIFAMLFTNPGISDLSYLIKITSFWEKGFWELLAFTTQMILMLVLGHTLALTKSANKLINSVVKYCNTTQKAAFVVTLLTVLISLFNWGLGLIFGAILARKVGESAKKQGFQLNYPLIGAAGYSGLMVWHGGFSGSAPLKIAEQNHFLADSIGQVLINETILSAMNISVSIALILILPFSMYLLAKKSINYPFELKTNFSLDQVDKDNIKGAEKLDHSRVFTLLFSMFFIFIALDKIFRADDLAFLNLNYINFLLFGLGLLMHGNISRFINAVNKAIVDSTGILIQFPLYAGIMGIMKYSGLTIIFTDFFINISTQTTFPIYTLISAGIVNIFVPSGGGQWIVQGPIIIEAAKQLNVPVAKAVMALAYGDQLTNMLQPFWALPLLGITGLKAKEIIPYTFFLMVIGLIIYITGLLVF
ncbi:MAG: short-chain fatty acid transporter [Bacteroidetes bacterium]|nr:MAG: short-chain fatty acid transporter [Bacteroidota bacterium]